MSESSQHGKEVTGVTRSAADESAAGAAAASWLPGTAAAVGWDSAAKVRA